jgi:hypothetical protein
MTDTEQFRVLPPPELGQLQAHLSPLMTYRFAPGVLEQMLPVDAGISHETLRNHTLILGEQLQDRAVDKPATAAAAIDIGVDSTFVPSCEVGERHLEATVGNVETGLEHAKFSTRSREPIPTSSRLSARISNKSQQMRWTRRGPMQKS